MNMVGKIASVSVYVRDLEQALPFYIDQLGFEKRSATPLGSDARSVTVARGGGQTELVLSAPPAAGRTQRDDPDTRIGSFTGIVFAADDIERDYQDLSDRGVRFGTPPKQEAWGTWAQFEDLDGNTFLLMQPAPVVVARTPRSERL